MDIYFILVEPILPENIGASARALKTMGFSYLRLVNPCNHLDKKARILAYGSVDILQKAEIFPNLEQAMQGIDLVIGTTAKKRSPKHDYYASDEITSLISNKSASINSLAMVFGREDKGLSNTQVSLCDIVTSIPMKSKYPSLNLAQSVMVYAYLLSPLVLNQPTRQEVPTNLSQLSVLKQTVKSIMTKIGYSQRSNIYNRIRERLGALTDVDIHLLHSVGNRLLHKITQMNK